MTSNVGDLNIPPHHRELVREFQHKFLEEGVYLTEQQVFGRIVLCALRDAHHLTDEQRMEMLFGVDWRDKDLSQLPEGVTFH